MKTLYFECNMGAAGDMLTAALLELHPQPEQFLQTLNTIGLPEIVFTAQKETKCGMIGTKVSVTIHGEEEHEHHHEHHHHTGLSEIRHAVHHLSIPQTVKDDILAVYQLIATAESKAHGVSVEEVHFHEVGAWDAVADVTAVCLLLHELNPQQILASPIHVGAGHVHCAHGILPVPAPATADLLCGVPIYGGAIQGELCTPTGAALLRHFVAKFTGLPVMSVSKIGIGCGTKEFEQANCVRAFWGDTQNNTDTITQLSCNLDDMTGEDIGFAVDVLSDAGALDVYTTPVQMKKNRPGVVLTCLCCCTDAEKLTQLLFKHTTTLGIRDQMIRRHTLPRNIVEKQTPFGRIKIKQAGKTEKWEHDDLVTIAKQTGLSLAEIRKQL